MITTTTRSRTTAGLLGVAALVLALAGCAAPAATEPAAALAADQVTVTDGWAKAADEGMSAAFGILENSGDADATIVSVETAASTMVELHETVANDAGEMVMRPKEGGFVIPAGGSLELAPGGNHIMFMDLTAPLEAGAEIELTLTFSDGSTLTVTVPVKDFEGANENYEGGMDMGGDDMDMGGSDQ